MWTWRALSPRPSGEVTTASASRRLSRLASGQLLAQGAGQVGHLVEGGGPAGDDPGAHLAGAQRGLTAGGQPGDQVVRRNVQQPAAGARRNGQLDSVHSVPRRGVGGRLYSKP